MKIDLTANINITYDQPDSQPALGSKDEELQLILLGVNAVVSLLSHLNPKTIETQVMNGLGWGEEVSLTQQIMVSITDKVRQYADELSKRPESSGE